jgi:hypothetical protein
MVYNMKLQKREIGIRMALGAQRRDVSAQSFGDVLAPRNGPGSWVFPGMGLTRLIQNQLLRVKPTDPLTKRTRREVLKAEESLRLYQSNYS